MDPNWTDGGFLLALERFGYDVTDALAATVAFQRRFRPELVDGTIDGECRGDPAGPAAAAAAGGRAIASAPSRWRWDGPVRAHLGRLARRRGLLPL